MENKYFAELARRLRAAGITAGRPEKNRLTVLLNNQPVLSVSAGSDVFLLPAGSNQPEAGELYHKVAQTADEVYAYVDAVQTAPLLHASGLSEEFHLLADFGGAVLAGRELENGWGYQFVTWIWDHDRTGVSHGHYARVSSDSEDQVNSYIAQVDFYSKHIAGKEDWEMVDIYADEGISGLEARNRDDFNRMMADCREGKIDRVLCKSISRFARNTQEYIQFVRELLRLGISIHFEKENIDTGKMTSEQVAQIYGAFAQMESTNHSSNMRFSVRMRMEKGLFVPSSVPYGYRLAGRDLEIIPEEAEVVRRIFSAYLSGQGKDDIAREMNQLGVDRGRNREKWYPSTVAYILTNISYTGDMIWQKSCATDTIPFRQVRNLGQKPRYFVEHSHPAIVSCADFQRVQELMSSRKGQFHGTHRISKGSLYDKHIYCGGCGSLCRKKITGGKTYWVCRRHDGNKADCPTPQIPEPEITAAVLRLYHKLKLGQETVLRPVLSQLQELRERELRSNRKISDIDNEIARISEQNLVLVRLKSKGYVDSALYLSQMDEIDRKLRELRKLRRRLLEAAGEDRQIHDTERMMEYLEDGPEWLDEVPAELFGELIERIIIISPERLKFRLLNGMELAENIERTVR